MFYDVKGVPLLNFTHNFISPVQNAAPYGNSSADVAGNNLPPPLTYRIEPALTMTHQPVLESNRSRFSLVSKLTSAVVSRNGRTSSTTACQLIVSILLRTRLRQLSSDNSGPDHVVCRRALFSKMKLGEGHWGSLRYQSRSYRLRPLRCDR